MKTSLTWNRMPKFIYLEVFPLWDAIYRFVACKTVALLCSHLLQGNWLPIRFVFHAIGMHILLSRQSTYFPALMCLRRCVDGLWLGVLSLVALQEAEPGKSCVNMNSVKDWKNYNASFDAAQTKKTNIVRWAITSGSGDQAIDLVGHEDAGCKSQ